MNIIYIANARFPNEKAHGIQFAKTCESFSNFGVNLELVLPKKKTKIEEDPFSYYDIKNKFKYKKIWAPNFFPKTTFGFLLSSFIFGIVSFFYVLKNKNAVIYSIDLDPVSFFLFPFLKQSYFFEMHGPKKNNFLNCLLFKKTKGIIAINEAVKNGLIKNFPYLKDKIIICQNGLDLKENCGKEKARKKLGIDLSKKAVVYTGSFQDWKGIETIFNAAKELSDIEFYFVGFSREKLDLTDNVYLMGQREFKEMPLWRAAADILIVTGTKKDDYSFYYTSPMKLFEYMGAKKPIVASRTPAIEQVVSDKEVFFHEPDNAQDLADKIEYIFKNPEGAGKKSEFAYIKAREYTWNKRAKKILKFIEEKI
jgi:glycosyltransferase involved in cell wall biosynthesis